MKRIPAHAPAEAAEHVARGDLFPSDPALSERFAAWLEAHCPFLPVTGYSLDWSRIDGATRFDWGDREDAQAASEFLYGTTLAAHRFTAVYYGRREPCLVGKFYFVAPHLRDLIPDAPIPRYLFGVDGEPGQLTPTFADFAEIDGAGRFGAFPKPRP